MAAGILPRQLRAVAVAAAAKVLMEGVAESPAANPTTFGLRPAPSARAAPAAPTLPSVQRVSARRRRPGLRTAAPAAMVVDRARPARMARLARPGPRTARLAPEARRANTSMAMPS